MRCSYCGQDSPRSICERCAGVLGSIQRGPHACGLEARAATTATPSKVRFDVDELLRRDSGKREAAPSEEDLCGLSTVDSIDRGLEQYAQRWSLVEFELTVTYGSRRQAESLFGGPIARVPPFGICGTTANQLACLFLGSDRAAIITRQLNSLVTATREQRCGSQTGLSRYEECRETSDGVGVPALRQALRRLSHCLVLVSAGPNHRFVLERRPAGSIIILQSWIDGYSLSHWLAPSNRSQVSHPLDQFLDTLETASGQGLDEQRAANARIFHPVGIIGLDCLDRGALIRFSAMALEPRSVQRNVEYFFEHSRPDEPHFAP